MTETRLDTRLTQLGAVGQGPYLRLLNHWDRRCEAKDRKNKKKVKYDGQTNQQTNGPTDQRMV